MVQKEMAMSPGTPFLKTKSRLTGGEMIQAPEVTFVTIQIPVRHRFIHVPEQPNSQTITAHIQEVTQDQEFLRKKQNREMFHQVLRPTTTIPIVLLLPITEAATAA